MMLYPGGRFEANPIGGWGKGGMDRFNNLGKRKSVLGKRGCPNY